jgi:hypothetical protein
VNGLPDGATINVVREDPKRRGLLFAGSETQVWVSFDDGDHWSSLRLNMPATSIRDLVIKDDDIAVGTHGRSFWILDDIASLRQLTAATERGDATLFKPAAAYRFRWSKYTDTPLPPDEPYGQNPPDGAIIDYHLGAERARRCDARDPRAERRVIRTYSSRDTSMAPRTSATCRRTGFGQRRCYPRRRDSTGSCGTCTTRRRRERARSQVSIPSPQRHTTRRANRVARARLPGDIRCVSSSAEKPMCRTFTVKMDPRVRTPAAIIAQNTRHSCRAIRRHRARFGDRRAGGCGAQPASRRRAAGRPG